MGLRNSNHSTVQVAVENFFARFERELNEIEVGLSGIKSSNKIQIRGIIKQKLEFLEGGLRVFLDQEKNNLSRPEKAEVQLLQRFVGNFKRRLSINSTAELQALLQSLHRQLELVLG